MKNAPSCANIAAWCGARIAGLLAIGYALAVLGALLSTLHSLSTQDYDGLNNILQIPLGLPWVILVPSFDDTRVDAFVFASLGWLNAALLYLLLRLSLKRPIGKALGGRRK